MLGPGARYWGSTPEHLHKRQLDLSSELAVDGQLAQSGGLGQEARINIIPNGQHPALTSAIGAVAPKGAGPRAGGLECVREPLSVRRLSEGLPAGRMEHMAAPQAKAPLTWEELLRADGARPGLIVKDRGLFLLHRSGDSLRRHCGLSAKFGASGLGELLCK